MDAKEKLAQVQGAQKKKASKKTTTNIPRASGGQEREKAKAQSASLYKSDYTNIKEIKQQLERALDFDKDPSNSIIIRIALELCTRERGKLAQAYKEIIMKDGRIKSPQ